MHEISCNLDFVDAVCVFKLGVLNLKIVLDLIAV